jgi:hypothetical protein
MIKTELLNNVSHMNLRVMTQNSAKYGDNVGTVQVFPSEFEALQKEYPIFFRKDAESGQLQTIAMLGLKQDENLFLDENNWNANYIPSVISRGPFLIGFQDQSSDGGDEKTLVVHVDMDNSRISTTEGKTVFTESGGQTPYLNNINAILMNMYDGVQISKILYAALTALDLIEPVNLDIELANGERHRLHGNYTVSEKKLMALDGDALSKLNAAGLLKFAFLMITSMSNVKKLVDMKNHRLSANSCD